MSLIPQNAWDKVLSYLGWYQRHTARFALLHQLKLTTDPEIEHMWLSVVSPRTRTQYNHMEHLNELEMAARAWPIDSRKVVSLMRRMRLHKAGRGPLVEWSLPHNPAFRDDDKQHPYGHPWTHNDQMYLCGAW